jgi:hypothetical protein
MPLVEDADNIESMTKFVVFFQIDDDPELLTYLIERIKAKMTHFGTEQIIQIIVNIKHTLSPEAMQVVEQANIEFVERLSDNYNPNNRELYL